MAMELGLSQTITARLVDRVDEQIKADIVYWAAFYEHRIRLGSKPIFHLEGECLTRVGDRRCALTVCTICSFLCEDHERVQA